MPRFRHKRTGLFVTVGDARAGSLPGSEWERVEPVEVKPAPAPRRRKRKTDDDN